MRVNKITFNRIKSCKCTYETFRNGQKVKVTECDWHKQLYNKHHPITEPLRVGLTFKELDERIREISKIFDKTKENQNKQSHYDVDSNTYIGKKIR